MLSHRTAPKIASGYYYLVFDGSTQEGQTALASPTANGDELTFTTTQLPAGKRYKVVVRATTGRGAVYSSTEASAYVGVGEAPVESSIPFLATHRLLPAAPLQLPLPPLLLTNDAFA